MKIKPSIVLADLEEYLDLYSITLSDEVKATLIDVEEFAYRCDSISNYNLFFSKVIKNSKVIRDIFENEQKNPYLAALILEKDYYNCIDKLSSYHKEGFSYSQIHDRKRNEKTAIIDTALEYCVKDNRKSLKNIDIFLSAMDEYEKNLDEDNSNWVDKRLNNSYTTLSHICGHYDENLEIKFNDIREILIESKEKSINIQVA